MKKYSVIISAIILSLVSINILASEEDDMAEMQRKLNQEVMSKDFDPGDAAKVDAYIAEAMKKGLKPTTVAPKYWQNGYTCRDIRRYGYAGYQNCMYHYRYYGRYW